VTVRGIYVRTLRTYGARAGYLLILGAAVFIPLGLIDSIANEVAVIDTSEIEALSDLAAVGLVAAVVVQAITSLLGEVFYAGAVALALAGGVEAKPSSLTSVARRLAYWRLIAVDLLFVTATALGFVALIVPGILLFTWFALAGPVVELEGAGVKAAFARSRRLVRGHFWAVLLVLLPITVASEALSAVTIDGFHQLIHSPLVSDWVGEALANILLSPFYAVAAVLMTLELSRETG
jgi:hypothetical protein